MRTLVKLRVYRFGNFSLYQKSVIPSGGPVSGAILESVLCRTEHWFDLHQWPTFAKPFGLKGKREAWVTLLRYVVDVLRISFWLCPSCLGKLIDEIYRNVVKLDKSNDGKCQINGFNGIKFLDLLGFRGAGKNQRHTFLVNKNVLYAVSGVSSLLVRN